MSNGGFPEPLGGDGVRLVESRHESCGHATEVRLPGVLEARIVRRVVCSHCGLTYETTRVEDHGIDQELEQLTAAVAAPAPVAEAESEPEAEVAAVMAPEPVAPALPPAAPAQAPVAAEIHTPASATPADEAPAKPKRRTAVGPEIKLPSFKRKPKVAAASAEAPAKPEPTAKPKRRTAVGPELKMPSFKRKPREEAQARAAEPTPSAPAAPVVSQPGTENSTAPPSLGAPTAQSPAPAAPQRAAKPKRRTAVGPEIKMPSFKRKAADPAEHASAIAASAAAASERTQPGADGTEKPRRKTAIGPELKMPSFKRKAKPGTEAAPAPAPAPAPASGAGPRFTPRQSARPNIFPPVGSSIPNPTPIAHSFPGADAEPATPPAPEKPKRRTAVGPEIKMPSFARKPKPLVEPGPAGAPKPKRRTAVGPEIKLPSFKRGKASPMAMSAGGPGAPVPAGMSPAMAGPAAAAENSSPFSGLTNTTWRRISVPICAGAVIIGLLLIQGGGGDTSNLPTTSPGGVAATKAGKAVGGKGQSKASVAKQAAAKNAQVVAGSNFTLALPKGWQRINPSGGATFAALASDGSADATLWIKRDPKLDFASFEADSLKQLEGLSGSAKVIDREQGPSVEQTIVTLGTDAPKGAPDYQVVLRASGPYFYYLATTLQPDAGAEATDGVALVQDSLLPTGGSK